MSSIKPGTSRQSRASIRTRVIRLAVAAVAMALLLPGSTFSSPKSQAQTATYSIWPATATPAATDADTNSTIVGVKFRSDVAGYVTGIRFHKAAVNTGVHTGKLWTAAGAELGNVTFTGETASGWQQASFASPIAIAANTTYIASYLAPGGRYSVTNGGFAAAGVDAPPLHALRDGVDGGNGVYLYSASHGFPNNTFQSENYWVDVVFVTSLGPDTTPPTVSSSTPATGATGVALGTTVTATFSEAMDAATISTATVELRDPANALVTATVGYNATTRVATLTPSAPLTASTVYTATIRGGATDPRVKDVAGNALVANTSWSFTTVAVDTTPPTVTTFTPASAATGVSTGTTVTATFSENMDPATISTATFELRNPANALVTATVAYNAATRVATLTPSAPLTASTIYTSTIRGGATDPRAKDLAANALAANVSWSFTTASGPVCPCSIWAPTAAAPGIDSDTNSVVVGVRFRSDVSGYISGIRFYKGANNTGTHTGKLWTNTGVELGAVTFSGETASGWQEATFANPIAIAANTTYVASYLAPVGRYGVTNQGFASAGVDAPPLHALRDGVDGANGLYLYSASHGFPSNTFQSENYWVDVVFVTNVGPDTTPPAVSAVSPAAGATNAATVVAVTATFSEVMDPATVATSTFELRQGTAAGPLVPAAVSYDVSTRVATLQPTSPLSLATTYTAIVKGGALDPRAKDVSGNALAADHAWSFTTAATDPCAANPIAAENCLPGNPATEWDISGIGDASIQGFATNMSVNRGTTVSFKIDTTASAYTIDIYRLGYYGGLGARKVATVSPSASLPQGQPGCLSNAATGLVDCGNWGVSASWAVPANAVSGVYIARPRRTDTSGASHIVFIVRDDASTSDIVLQTSDTTWQAYNSYGGNSFYAGSPAGRAYKLSYNRPFNTRIVDNGQDWLFNADYPMLRWLERNGYNVSYITGIDADRAGALIANHRMFISVGHDEYWSNQQRLNVEAARNAGTSLAFFSGNEVYWKTRWENSIDGSGTTYRTLVCYKETHANAKIDPNAAWTGTWRDPRFSPPADGGRPENALTGTLFTVNDGATTSIAVPEADGKMRFWRNTTVATLTPGQSATMPFGTLGYEWDEDIDNGFRPAGLVGLSRTTVANAPVLIDYGSTFGTGTATHKLTLYRHASGALVFGAGTVQWAWGLDATHDRAGTPVDIRMQQATVNLFADMAVQPTTLQAGLTAASQSTDLTPPTSTITSPANGASVATSTSLTVTGTAVDSGGGVVGAVEVSTDGGLTWRPATGRTSWSYTFTTPSTGGSRTILSRAADDSARIETPSAGVTINVGSDTTPPTVTATSPVNGATAFNVTANVTATFSEPMTAASITTATFELRQGGLAGTPVPAAVTYNATTRVATLNPTGSLLQNVQYTAIVRGGASGVRDANNVALAADVSWSFTTATDTTAPTVTATAPANGATGVSTATSVTATFSEAMDPATVSTSTIELRDPANALVTATVSYNTATSVATLVPGAALLANTTYTATVRGGAADPRAKDVAGLALAANVTWSFTTTAPISRSINFDGTNDYVNVAHAASLDIGTTATFEFFVKPTATPTNRRGLIGKTTWQVNVLAPASGAGVNFEFRTRTTATGTFRTITTGTFALNQWYHVAATYNGTTMRLFVNGVEQGTGLAATGTIDSTTALVMGVLTTTSGRFPGRIDEVRLSNTVRYTANFTPPTLAFTVDASTRALWHFNEGAGTTTADVSGNANTGTLVNGPTWNADVPVP